MKYPYIEVLTKEERAIAMAAGVAKVASEKEAAVKEYASLGKDALLALMAAAVATGVPLGLVAHSVDKGSKRMRNKEVKRLGAIDQYLDAADRLAPQVG